MSKVIMMIRQAFCDHNFGNGIINPFVDQYGNHSAIYICEKCGKKEFHTFHKNN